MTTTVGKARIDIEVDGSGISKSLEAAMDRALAAVSKSADAAFGKVEKDAASAGDEIGSGIGDGAKAAERALSSIGTDGIDNISKAASDAADAVSKSSSDAADSLSDVGAAGAEAGATASGAMASSMADVTSAAATAGARAADSLSGVGGAASEAGATASGAMASSMADVSSSAASAFSAVSASAADAAGGVAASAADMSASMSGAMASIEGAAAGAVGAVGGAGGGLGNLARKAGPAAAALAGVAGAGATVKAGFDKLTSIEDTTASLGIILGDLDQATSLMDKLQEDNLTTPYMFDAYAGAGKTLAAFGADLEGIPEQVRALGEAAAASGGGQAVFDSMARASGQAMATGKMSLDTINQLAVGGVQGLQILANHFDVPTSEMQKMISQGMVPAQEGMDILTQGILEGSDGIAGATQSMSGVMQEMSETTSGSMTNLLAGFTNLASAGIQPLLPAIQALADGMTKLSYFIIDVVNGDLDGWMGTVLDIAKPLSITIGALTAAVAALVVQQKIAAAGGFLKWLGSFNAITKVSTAVQAAFNAVMAANPIVLVTLAVAALVAGLAYFFTQTETGQRIWQGFMDALGTAWEWLSGVFAGVWDTISEAATSAFQWISDAWDTLWGGIQAVWEAVGQPVVDFVVAAFSLWWEGVQLYFRLLRAAWEVLWTGLQMAWDAFGQPVVDFVVAAFQLWWEGVQVIFGWVQTGWEMLWAGVQAVYDTVIAPVVQWVMDKFEVLRGAVGTAIEAVKGVIQSLADRLAAFYGDYVQPMVDRFLRGFNRIKDTVTGLKDTILDALKGAGTWLVDTGKNIVQGLIDGIKSLASTIGDAFLNLIPEWIKGPFKVALGIESPSKVFAEYGQNIGEGLVEGIGDMEGRVGDAVEGITEAATPAAVAAPALAAYDPLAAPVAAPQAVPAPMPMSEPIAPEISTTAAVDLDAAGLAGAMGEAGESVVAVREDMIDPALAGMAENLTGLAATAGIEGQNLTNAMNLAGVGMLGAKDTLVDPALWGMQANLTQTALTTQTQMLGMALPAMQQTGAGIMDVQTGTVNPALTAMQGAVSNTQAAFSVGATGISTEFARVRPGTADPARFAIQTVFNDGIVAMWNGVAEMIGTDKIAPHPVRFASGTSNLDVLPGYTPGSDPYTFVEPRTGMTIGLSGGEAIMRPEVTRALGTHQIDNLNAAARIGGVSAVRRTLGQFSDGGVVGNFAGGGVVESIIHLVNKYFPGMSITSTYRNTNDHHGAGLAVDFSNGYDTTPQMQQAARFFHQNYAAGLLELIHWPLNGWQNIKNGAPLDYGAATNAEHRNHVHVAAPRPLPEPGGLVIPVPSGGGVAIDWTALVGSMLEPQADEIRDRIGGVSFPGIVGQLPGKVFESMYEPMKNTITEKMKEMGGSWSAGGGAEQWRGLAMQALARHGYNPADYIEAMLQQIDIESSGNPNVVNNWDSNAAIGTPSGGLLQVIEPTYRRVRNAYPSAFEGLPDDRMHPLTNLTAGVGAVRMDWGGPGNRWPTRGGYDLGGIASGIGLMPKHILDPERVLSPRQTEAFEAWMDAGAKVEDINKLVEAVTWREDPANLPVVQPEKVLNKEQEAVFDEWRGQGSQIDSIHELVDSMHGLQLDHPEIMGREINRRFRAWLGDAPEDNTGDVRHLVAALEAGVEWERVVHGMQRSAEAWANGQWVQVGEDTRLATPAEMGQQVSENFLEELADELGGYVGLRGLYKGRDIVGESGLVKLELPDEVKDAEIVPSTEGAPVVATATPTATGKATVGEAQNVEVTVNIDVSGVNDPMAVSDLVMAKVGKGVEEAIGTARSQ